MGYNTNANKRMNPVIHLLLETARTMHTGPLKCKPALVRQDHHLTAFCHWQEKVHQAPACAGMSRGQHPPQLSYVVKTDHAANVLALRIFCVPTFWPVQGKGSQKELLRLSISLSEYYCYWGLSSINYPVVKESFVRHP